MYIFLEQLPNGFMRDWLWGIYSFVYFLSIILSFFTLRFFVQESLKKYSHCENNLMSDILTGLVFIVVTSFLRFPFLEAFASTEYASFYLAIFFTLVLIVYDFSKQYPRLYKHVIDILLVHAISRPVNRALCIAFSLIVTLVIGILFFIHHIYIHGLVLGLIFIGLLVLCCLIKVRFKWNVIKKIFFIQKEPIAIEKKIEQNFSLLDSVYYSPVAVIIIYLIFLYPLNLGKDFSFLSPQSTFFLSVWAAVLLMLPMIVIVQKKSGILGLLVCVMLGISLFNNFGGSLTLFEVIIFIYFLQLTKRQYS